MIAIALYLLPLSRKIFALGGETGLFAQKLSVITCCFHSDGFHLGPLRRHSKKKKKKNPHLKQPKLRLADLQWFPSLAKMVFSWFSFFVFKSDPSKSSMTNNVTLYNSVTLCLTTIGW